MLWETMSSQADTSILSNRLVDRTRMYPHRSTLNTISCLFTDCPCLISNGNKGKKLDSFLCSSLRPVTFEAMTILLGRKWPGSAFATQRGGQW